MYQPSPVSLFLTGWSKWEFASPWFLSLRGRLAGRRSNTHAIMKSLFRPQCESSQKPNVKGKETPHPQSSDRLYRPSPPLHAFCLRTYQQLLQRNRQQEIGDVDGSALTHGC